jgi:methane monooxygenase regulatory protein B
MSAEVFKPLTVGVVLMKSEEAQATVDYCRDLDHSITVTDCGPYFLLESEGDIRIPLAQVEEYLGKPLTLSRFLVVMSTYYGRVQTTDDMFMVTPEVTQLDRATGPGAPA